MTLGLIWQGNLDSVSMSNTAGVCLVTNDEIETYGICDSGSVIARLLSLPD